MSPRGADAFQKHSAAVEQRRAAAAELAGPKADFFGLPGPDGNMIAIVRFLEQGADLTFAACHRIPMPGREYPQDVICLDQEDDGTPCPACQSENKNIRARSTKGFLNLIWRGGETVQAWNQQLLEQNQQRIAANQAPLPLYSLAPVYKRNEFGSPEKDPSNPKKKIITGYADGVFFWKCSKTAFEDLVSKDSTYKGLMSRDFTIRRQGMTKDDTKYFVEPLFPDGGPAPMLVADLALAEKRYDLDKFTASLSYEDFLKLLSGQPIPATSQGPQPTADLRSPPPPPVGENAFAGGPPIRSAFARPPGQ